MLAALARELVEKDGVGQSADAIWSQLKQIYDQLPAGAQSSEGTKDGLPVLEPVETSTFTEVPAVNDVPLSGVSKSELLVTSALDTSTPTVFGQTLSANRRRTKRRHENGSQQGSLFSWN